ncbi:putative chromosome transmission fidelity protein [Thermochaetoides thermophila DSM 1495]|uniref:Putative chromosome transmission fidelity protein n=1 Tax=Chaetomium thermophilum (strain DSM 1495 / CBS 144.50 / IMI 039719) TaxID=759272 RepID=G0RYZ6_CHATD|nr:putative chromosome transmission fidelity protein [Thermochaetoides thermophila DSM 1495]EGS23424.1 putative chromosome transmission fidelity protein [Thermochaetoides thermophila DSM 1495]
MSSIIPSAPCTACNHPRPPNSGGMFTSFRSSLAAMRSQAQQAGCVTCWILCEGIRHYLEDKQGREDSAYGDVDTVQINLNVASTSARSVEVVLFFETPVTLSFFCEEQTPWLAQHMPDIPLGNAIPHSTSSSESLTWAADRIQHCIDSHEPCRHQSPDCPLPTRLLDLTAPVPSGIRLIESSSLPSQSPYACLSHCWGKSPFLRTLRQNLPSLKQEIDWDSLPKTFQDAISFTRRLGISYLWIDSLCIVQDDEDDWRKEAAKMAGIYRGARVVISAARGTDAGKGMFSSLEGDWTKICTVRLTPPTGRGDGGEKKREERIYVRRAIAHITRPRLRYMADITSTWYPLFTRGWVSQERLLAPRIVHFGWQELTLECRAHTRCQCTPVSAADYSDVNSTTAKFHERHTLPKRYYFPSPQSNPTLGSTAGGSTIDSIRALRTRWRHLVEDYTRLHLTFPKDVFPAISGVARAMMLSPSLSPPASRSSHKSGSNSPIDMETMSELKLHTEAGWIYAAGLWWGPVMTSSDSAETDQRPDPLGELVDRGSYLVVKGVMIPTKLRVNLTVRDAVQPWNAIDLDVLMGYVKNVWADEDCRDWAAGGQDQMVWCLPLGQTLPRGELMCLVLVETPRDGSIAASERLPQEEEELYKRVGLVQVLGGPPGQGLDVWMERLLQKGDERVVRVV